MNIHRLTDERSRVAFWLRQQGKTLEEIGKIMGYTRARAKQLLDHFEKLIHTPLVDRDLTKE